MSDFPFRWFNSIHGKCSFIISCLISSGISNTDMLSDFERGVSPGFYYQNKITTENLIGYKMGLEPGNR